jgi:hypothetical protein
MGALTEHVAATPPSTHRFCHFEFAGASTSLTCENGCPPGVLSP